MYATKSTKQGYYRYIPYLSSTQKKKEKLSCKRFSKRLLLLQRSYCFGGGGAEAVFVEAGAEVMFEEAGAEVVFEEAGAETEVVFEEDGAEAVFEEVGAEAVSEEVGAEAVFGAAGDLPNGVLGGGWSHVSPRM